VPACRRRGGGGATRWRHTPKPTLVKQVPHRGYGQGRRRVSLALMRGGSLWDRHSAWWQETFTEGADAEYEEQVLPLVEHHLKGAQRVLDVGCGEGQVARRVARLGADVVGIDPTLAQVRAAYERGGPPRFVRARAEHLPCMTAAFDAVLVCLALEHVDPFEPAISEIARVLVPGGRFLLLLTHPLLQAPGSGWVEDEASGESYWRVGAYLQDDVSIDEVAPGVCFEFAHRALSRYVHAMGAAGLLIEDMMEPTPPRQVLVETGGFPNAATIPRLLLMSARRIA
jgi:SAM-dependent methyltransferase